CDDVIKHDFDVKHLIRTIMNSAAYQRSSRANEFNRQDEKYYSRYVIKRLKAEAMLDAISQVTGVPTVFPDYPVGMRAMQLPDARVNSYFLKAFGRPERINTCECERSSEPTVAQALHIIRLGFSDEAILNHLYLAALSRQPSQNERAGLLAVLKENGGSKEARRQAIEDVVWSVLTSKEFLFNH